MSTVARMAAPSEQLWVAVILVLGNLVAIVINGVIVIYLARLRNEVSLVHKNVNSERSQMLLELQRLNDLLVVSKGREQKPGAIT